MKIDRELRVDVVTITHGDGDRHEAIMRPKNRGPHDHGIELRLARYGTQENELPPKGAIVEMKLKWKDDDE